MPSRPRSSLKTFILNHRFDTLVIIATYAIATLYALSAELALHEQFFMFIGGYFIYFLFTYA